MARSRRKARGCKRGAFKQKRMGKGWSTVRELPVGTRPVLKITPTEDDSAEEKKEKAEARKEAAEALEE